MPIGGGFNPDRLRTVTCAHCEVMFHTTARFGKYCAICSMTRAARYSAAQHQKRKAARAKRKGV